MPRVLVVLPTSSYRTADFVAAAERLGVDLTIASEEDPPIDLGENFVRIDCHDPEAAASAIVATADRSPIDAVVAADDAGVVIAALASEQLGLTGNTPTAAAATRDKLVMRRLLAAAEVPQPAFAELGDDPAEASAVTGFPLVVKPRTGAASRGVLRVDDPAALPAAMARVRGIAGEMGESGPLLVEAYVAGDEVAVEGLVTDGKLRILAVFDKPDTPDGPTFAETLMVTPSTLSDLTELERVVGAGVAALGLTDGPIHAEARVERSGRVHLLEIAARSIGGLCGRSLRFGLTNAGLEEQILAAALGMAPNAARQPRPSGVMMLPIETAGTLVGVGGVEAVRAMPGITEVDITIPPGTPVRPLPEGDRYLGFVFAVGATSAEVADRLRDATARLDIRIE